MADVSLWLVQKFEEDVELSECGTFVEDANTLFKETADREGRIPFESLEIGEEEMTDVKEADFQKDMDSYLEQIAEQGKTIQVIREDGRNIVIMSMEAYNKLIGCNCKYKE